MKPVALITGISGQDGSYLAEMLTLKEYNVVGTVKKITDEIRHLIDSIDADIELVETPELTADAIEKIVRYVQPSELYNLAGQSSVGRSWHQTTETLVTNGQSVVYWLEAIRRFSPKTRFLQASSSEIFGKGGNHPLCEETAIAPINPYGLSKSIAHGVVVKYREWFGLFLCNAIMFNHESPRRSTSFVSRKITNSVARIKLGLQKELLLGNLEVVRDWGFAGDHVEALWRMLQIQNPEDFVLGTGRAYSLRDFVKVAFECVELDWQKYTTQDPDLFRPADVERVQANPAKARSVLDWRPTISFRDLVSMMVNHDLMLIQADMAAELSIDQVPKVDQVDSKQEG